MSYVDRTPTNSAFNEYRDKIQRISVNTSQRWGTYNTRENMKNLFASTKESFLDSLDDSVFESLEESNEEIKEKSSMNGLVKTELNEITTTTTTTTDSLNRSSSRVQAQEKAEIRRKWQNLIHSASKIICN